MAVQQELIRWLLDSDPAIRWQVMRDILHESPAAYEKEREQLTQIGWCAQLLNYQDDDGLWNRSLYNGKWLSTTYSLYLLKVLGLAPGNPQALKGCDQLLTQGLYQQKEIRFSRNKDISALGVTAIILSICCYFGYDVEAIPRIAGFLVCQQGVKGNWLPNESQSAMDYTFETTFLVLEAFLQYTNRYARKENSAISTAVQRGLEFLIRHNLGLSDQGPIKNKWASFSFPSYWFYDVLTSLDYFYAFRGNKNKGLEAAISLLRHRQSENGTWHLGCRHSGKTFFDMEKVGKPSRWTTLRALRVLEWWDSSE